jgi:hypothetical protein
MTDPTERELRQQKHEIKRAGSRRRRRQWKRQLSGDEPTVTPEDFDFGRLRSADLNGLDRDVHRRRLTLVHGGEEPESSV